MLRNKALPVWLALGLSAGCGKAPEAVYVTVPESVPVARPEPPPGNPVSVSVKASLPEVRPRNAFIGSGEEEAKRAIQTAKKNQERAFQEALASLRHTLLAQVEAESQARDNELRVEYDARFTQLFADLRATFEAHADKVGPKWVRLATIAGFPDDAKPRRRGRRGFLEQRTDKEADALRSEIAALDAQYRRTVSERVEGLRQELRLKASEGAAARIYALDEAERQAEAEARKATTEALKGLEASLIQTVQRLPGVPGESVAFETRPFSSGPLPPDPGPEWAKSDRLKRLAGLFARIKGYRLVGKGPGVRDATKEFLAWMDGKDGR
ncbi:MAG: hypothetical protein JST30_04745 [Armatimonadetes bacterium]|nr:hypothetical protein [Armatimonadota bacterium]